MLGDRPLKKGEWRERLGRAFSLIILAGWAIPEIRIKIKIKSRGARLLRIQSLGSNLPWAMKIEE